MLYVNPAYERIYGRSRKSLYSAPRSFLDAIHPEDRERVLEGVQQRRREAWQYEYRIIRPDGAIRWIRDRGYPIFGEDGNLRLMTGISNDITDHKHAELALQESEIRLRALLDACTDTAFLIDAGGNLLTLNETVARRFGKTVDEMTGANVYAILDPETARSRKEKIDAAISSGRPVRFEDERAGILFDNHLYPIPQATGATAHLAVYARDITEQRRAENQLKKTLELLEQRVEQRTEELSKANRALENEIKERKRAYQKLAKVNTKLKELERFKEDLVYMVIHDMKNPVSSSMLALDVIHMEVGKQLTPRQAEYLQVAKRSQFKLSQMIANLLEVSKLEENKFQVIRMRVDLEEMISRILEPYGEMRGHNRPSVRITIDPHARLFSSDPYLLERIISNVVSNAIKHSHSIEEISVCARRDETNREILISIEDKGQGIPKEHHEKIFEKFFQRNLKQEGHRADTGLGLAFCKLAVESLGGKIWVESEPGKGSRFTISLPDEP